MPNNIAIFRKLADLTQDEMASRLGVTQQTLSRKENGQVNITVPELYLIRDVLRKRGQEIGNLQLSSIDIGELYSDEAMKTNITPSAAPAQPGALEAAS